MVILGGGTTIAGVTVAKAGMTGPEVLLGAAASVVVLMIAREARIRRWQEAKTRLDEWHPS
jgi:hypothetical protein